MLSALKTIDTQAFLFFNVGLANEFFDVFFVFITNADHWILPLLLAAALSIVRFERRGPIGVRPRIRDHWRTAVAAILLAAVAVALSDLLCFRVLKPLIGRLRPCHPEHFIQGGRFLLGYKGSFSMPSNHAANMFALATLLTCFYTRHWIWFYSIAVLVAFSRVYVGVHYPADIIAGAVVGAAVGSVVYGGYLLVHVRRRRTAAVDPNEVHVSLVSSTSTVPTD
jgi:undecaprenyl-diphosphatase